MNYYSGIYLLTFKSTGDTYIGSAGNLPKRWSAWITMANKTRAIGQVSKEMKALIEQCTAENLQFEILEMTEYLKDREAVWIAKLKPTLNKTNPSILGSIPEDHPVFKEIEDELHKISEWWAALPYTTKTYIQWLYGESLRTRALRYLKSAGARPAEHLLSPKPCPLNADERREQIFKQLETKT